VRVVAKHRDVLIDEHRGGRPATHRDRVSHANGIPPTRHRLADALDEIRRRGVDRLVLP
jgi:hypothetical protein